MSERDVQQAIAAVTEALVRERHNQPATLHGGAGDALQDDTDLQLAELARVVRAMAATDERFRMIVAARYRELAWPKARLDELVAMVPLDRLARLVLEEEPRPVAPRLSWWRRLRERVTGLDDAARWT